VSSFSFHQSNFGGDLPHSDQLKSNKPLAPFCGTTSLSKSKKEPKLLLLFKLI
jgi:hypothetical protein